MAVFINLYANTTTTNVHIPPKLLLVSVSLPLVIVCNKGSHDNSASMIYTVYNKS